jgi:hypothetical protein
MAIRQETPQLVTQIQNVLNTQIMNVAAMHQQTKRFAKQFDQEMVMLRNEVLLAFALSTITENTSKSVLQK